MKLTIEKVSNGYVILHKSPKVQSLFNSNELIIAKNVDEVLEIVKDKLGGDEE